MAKVKEVIEGEVRGGWRDESQREECCACRAVRRAAGGMSEWSVRRACSLTRRRERWYDSMRPMSMMEWGYGGWEDMVMKSGESG